MWREACSGETIMVGTEVPKYQPHNYLNLSPLDRLCYPSFNDQLFMSYMIAMATVPYVESVQ